MRTKGNTGSRLQIGSMAKQHKNTEGILSQNIPPRSISPELSPELKAVLEREGANRQKQQFDNIRRNFETHNEMAKQLGSVARFTMQVRPEVREAVQAIIDETGTWCELTTSRYITAYNHLTTVHILDEHELIVLRGANDKRARKLAKRAANTDRS